MKKLLEKLLNLMGVGMEVVVANDGEVAHIRLPLGVLDGGTYEGKYWGDAVIEDTDASLSFAFGDLYGEGEYYFGEGVVNLNYAKGSGLAYTGDLEDVVTDRISDLYGLKASGSEQGMQGDDYLSLDIYTEVK